MPTYDYRCDACGHELEIFHSMKDSPKRKCPSCGKLKLVRQIGAGGGVIFKGSGFYETDYRSESYKRDASADSAKSTETNSSEAKSSESKPSESNPSGTKPSESRSSDSKKKSDKQSD